MGVTYWAENSDDGALPFVTSALVTFAADRPVRRVGIAAP